MDARFTVIGHACLFIEAGGTTILVDPWLAGSAYWRSWWHFPPSPDPRPEWLAPDYVYLTHHHFDHFHFPSMRRIDRSAHVLIPEFGVDVMAGEVRGLGFDSVTELPHGKTTTLAPGLSVASYQYATDDSAFVVGAGDHVIADLNDCKIRGSALRRVRDAFGRPDVMLKSHSWAQAYPLKYEADDPDDLGMIQRDSYWLDFVEVARELQPRYAVPFASMVAFLHPESRMVNEHVITPQEIKAHVDELAATRGTEVVTMAPGDSWDAAGGFERTERDWYGERDAHLARLATEVKPKIDAQVEKEQATPLDDAALERYFAAFLAAVPRLVRRRAVPRPVVFECPSSADPYLVVDVANGRQWRQRDAPAERATLVRIDEGLLADATEKRILHLVHASMRVRVHLRPGGTKEDTAFWLLLMLWELGYLPMRRLRIMRALRVAWRRRSEAGTYVVALRGSGTLQERMVSQFAAQTADYEDADTDADRR